MPITPPTREELFDRYKRAMEALGFTHWSEGSRIGAIGEVQAGYLEDLWLALADIETQTNPSTARGVYLDRLAQMFGLRRMGAQFASTLGKGPTVKFTHVGVGDPLLVPQSTRVWSRADPELAFFTAAQITVNAGSEGYVDVIAANPGDLYNLGVGRLDSHNAGMQQLQVTNVRPIGGGDAAESDERLRFRISQALQARHGATETAILQELLKVPGVRDALIYPGARGNGSLDVIVVPIDRSASQEMLDACEAAMAEVVAAGISWRVSPPVPRRVDIAVQLRLLPGTTIGEVRAQVDAAVRTYVDNLRVNDGRGGDELVYNELVSRVQDAHPDILDSALPLSLDGVPSLQTNLQGAPGERLVSGSVTVS